jgi:predicted GH43/DUF377 family glycosyl hydrolase
VKDLQHLGVEYRNDVAALNLVQPWEVDIVDKSVLLEPVGEVPIQGATNGAVLSEGEDRMRLHFGNGVPGASQKSG